MEQKRKEQFLYDCICKFCGKKFKGKTKRSNMCKGKHYKQCTACNKTFEPKNLHRPSKTCSSSCASKLSHTDEAKENRRKKSLERHGTEFPFQAESVVIKIRETLDKSENDTRIGSKRWNKMLNQKYNVDNISQVEEIKKRKEETYKKKFGVKNPAAMKIKNYKEWNDFSNFIEDKEWDCLDIANYFNTSVNIVRKKIRELNLETKIKDFHKYSTPELKIKKILESLDLVESIDYKPHSKIIKPLEVDFYIPALNLAIEVSPTHTHNSNYGWNKDTNFGLEKCYHRNKFLACREKGIRLITLFEWIQDEEIETILKQAILGTEEKRKGNILSLDMTTDNNILYKKNGFKLIKEIEEKLIYHNPKKNLVVKSNKTIRKHKDILERNGFLPVYNCGYEIWKLP